VDPAVPANDCLDVLDAGISGGPMEVRLPLILRRGFEVGTDGRRPFEGVLVLGEEVPDVAADANCFVGDLVGDYRRSQ
jgi:hypothetical protein